ncbi:MAG TPA: type II toxin-antitoxin system antitoxin, RelB/DinJ family [Lachnospiraceae bacterium]|nr:type II toxin-antitoxin system antitoxin, RelB/DinJ family [Lachnospiraceae bacterium]
MLQIKERYTMNKTTSIRIDEQLKEEATKLFSELGIGLNNAIIMFLKQAVREQQLPFQPTLNPTTLSAIKESEDIIRRIKEKDPTLKGYDDVSSMFHDIFND